MAAGIFRRLDGLRRRGQPPDRSAARSVTSRNAGPDVTGGTRCPVGGRRLPDRDRPHGARKARYCSGACKAKAYRACQQAGEPPATDGAPLPPAARHARSRRDPATGQRTGRNPGRHRQRPAGALRATRQRPSPYPAGRRRENLAPADLRTRDARRRRDRHGTRHDTPGTGRNGPYDAPVQRTGQQRWMTRSRRPHRSSGSGVFRRFSHPTPPERSGSAGNAAVKSSASLATRGLSDNRTVLVARQSASRRA